MTRLLHGAFGAILVVLALGLPAGLCGIFRISGILVVLGISLELLLSVNIGSHKINSVIRAFHLLGARSLLALRRQIAILIALVLLEILGIPGLLGIFGVGVLEILGIVLVFRVSGR